MSLNMTGKEIIPQVGGIKSLSNLKRTVTLPSEALASTDVIKLTDTLFSLKSETGLEVRAFVHEQDAMDLSDGKRQDMYVIMRTEDFEVLTSSIEGVTPSLSLFDESEENPTGSYRFTGKIEGFYDWHVHRGFQSSQTNLSIYVLLDVGYRVAAVLEIPLSDSSKVYFGNGDWIRGRSVFLASLSGYIEDPRRVIETPPWNKDRGNLLTAQREEAPMDEHVPSKSERKKTRRAARSDGGTIR